MSDHSDHYLDLRRKLSRAANEDLVALPSVADAALLEYIWRELPKMMISCSSEDFEILPNNALKCRGHQVRINISVATEDISKLEIAAIFAGIDLGRELIKVRRSYLNIASIGSIDRINFIYPSIINIDSERLLEEIREICDGTYNVLFEAIRLKIKSFISDLSEELYFTFRSLCKNRAIKDDFWFAGISGGHGFRLIDSAVGEYVVKNLPSAFNRSGVSLATELIDTALPVEGLLMKDVFNTDHPIDVDISDAEYGRNLSSYAEAMMALYRGTSFTIYPIYSDGDWAILALSGTKWKHEVSDIIYNNIDEFRSICDKSRRILSESLKKMTRGFRDGRWSSWGEFFGAATAEFLKGIANP